MHKVRMFGCWVLMLWLMGLGQVGVLGQSGVSIRDDRGVEVVVPQPVERVVVAGTPLYAEILVDIGALPLLVGVTDSANNPPEVAGVTTVGPSFPSPNVELIVDLAPDLVLGAVFDVRDQLESLGLVVLTPVSFIQSIRDLFTLIEGVGTAVGRAEAARLLVRDISLELVLIESNVIQETPIPAAFLFPSADGLPFAAGKGSFEAELIARAGGRNVFADVDGGDFVSFEEVIERDPQVIFTDPSQVALILDNPLLAEVAAVKGENVVGIVASSLTSTRVAQPLAAMARAMHPQAFETKAP